MFLVAEIVAFVLILAGVVSDPKPQRSSVGVNLGSGKVLRDKPWNPKVLPSLHHSFTPRNLCLHSLL